MKLEDFADLYFVVAVFVPGFIYCSVVSTFVPIRTLNQKEALFLRYLTATAFNYAILSPLVYLLVVRRQLDAYPFAQALTWFCILFIAPIAFAMLRAKIIQRDGFRWLFAMLGLRTISPIPTGWDWIFSTIDPCFILITLTDGTEIAGYFGKKSMASSDPENRDIFLQKVYIAAADNSGWAPLQGSLGVHIAGGQIAYVEFKERGNYDEA